MLKHMVLSQKKVARKKKWASIAATEENEKNFFIMQVREILNDSEK